MGQTIGGSQLKEAPIGEITKLGSSKLTVEDVEVIHIREVIRVPVIEEVTVPTTRYEVTTLETKLYEPTVVQTVRYEVEEKPTTRFVVRDEETVRFVERPVEVERPVVVDKLYERPVIQEKIYQLVSFTDLEAIKEAMTLLPKLIEEIKELKKTRIVEEIIKVPKINYIPTDVFRITQSGELVKNADTN